MKVLVAYGSRHGSTKGIAERIADRLKRDGVPAEALPADEVRNPDSYDAYVIGSAAYMFHWLKEPTTFIRRNRAIISSKPTWLFSSGPLGPDVPDAQGRDPRIASISKEVPELVEAAAAREHHVFFGAWDRRNKPIGIGERFVRMMPATKDLMPDGDFRDWAEIEDWADAIARSLQALPTEPPAPR